MAAVVGAAATVPTNSQTQKNQQERESLYCESSFVLTYILPFFTFCPYTIYIYIFVSY